MKRVHSVACALFALVSAGLLAACGSSGGGGGSQTPPAVTLTVAPTTVLLGQSATLSWAVTAGSSSSYSGTSSTTCTASGGWSGTQSMSGTQSVTPDAAGTATYTLTCNDSGGSGSATATLTVNAASAFSFTSLVSDGGVPALITDPNLVNPWGIVFAPGKPSWVANNHSGTSTLYDGNGVMYPAGSPLVVAFPNNGAGDTFDPTGIVYNSTTDFSITSGSNSGAAVFIYDGEGGAIGGWSPGVDSANVVIAYDDGAGGAIYKGLAIANNGSGNFLYATDFHNNKIDVFNAAFAKQTPGAGSFAFTDPNVPAGYAPFGIQTITSGGVTQLYVTYAQQDDPTDAHDNTNGAGLGIVDIYDTNGNLVKTLVSTGGALDAPWGLALAPSDFGTFSNDLLVGNFGDGNVNVYDPASGTYIGTLADSTGAAIAEPGLWGIAFGNDADNQPHNTLFIAAGINDEANGQYGRIDLGATPPVLNQPPVVTLDSPGSTISGTVSLSAAATDSVAIAKVEFFAGSTLIGTSTASASPYTVSWDTTTVTDGSVSLTAKATDVDGNVGTSTAVTVTVSNTVATPSVTLTAPSGSLSGSLALTAATANIGSVTKVQYFANGVALSLNGSTVAAATTAPYTTSWDTNFVLNGTVNLTAKATDSVGNVTTSDPVSVTVANAAVTLTDIQTSVFTPICSACHTGGGSSLPSSMNLTAGNSFSNIVSVASQEQPSLMRIKPGDPDNSYMIHKVEGAPGITGSQMPLGCSGSSCLSQDTIDKMRQWVYAGALNN